MQTGRYTVIEALNLARTGGYVRARRLLCKLRKQPEFEADAFYGLGLIEWCQQNSDNAKAYFRKATQVDPSHADAFYQLAKIADSRGDPVTAELYLKSAIAVKPGHVMAMEALAKHGVIMQAAATSGRSAPT
ncbi:MAG: tetratricopeptide repeat protein [Gammaproteobacteria bacterium]|nr:tetratricopeptide repeat protein [Gammaproteobacteria bacterium]